MTTEEEPQEVKRCSYVFSDRLRCIMVEGHHGAHTVRNGVDEELERLRELADINGKEVADALLSMQGLKAKLAPAKGASCLRALFGDDICTGDRVEIDGDEEPSGRFGFTLYDQEGGTKRCGVSPARVRVVLDEDSLQEARRDNRRLRDEIFALKFGEDSPVEERDRLRTAVGAFAGRLKDELEEPCLACTEVPCQACLQTGRILGTLEGVFAAAGVEVFWNEEAK